jgi:murein DD-endopeptidase MepM/ murein hydrolase activator NlpD
VFPKSAIVFKPKKEVSLGKLMVGVARFLLCAVVLVLPPLVASQSTPLTVQRVWTPGADGNNQSVFSPGETIQFVAELNNPYTRHLLAVEGTQVTIITGFLTKSEAVDIPPGISTRLWNATAPETEGNYTVTVSAFDHFSGMWQEGRANFTVKAVIRLASVQPPLLYFPWDIDENPWTLTQGPHDYNAGSQSGLDFDKDTTPRRVLSMFDGEVYFAGLDDTFYCKVKGQNTQNPTVKVRATDGSGWELWYLHLSRIDVLKGTPVSTGDLLGLSGKEGCSTDVHLHVELVIDGQHTSWWGKSIIGQDKSGRWLKWDVSSNRQDLNSIISTNPPIVPLKNWTTDENNNPKTSFARGEAIRYATEVRNVRNAPATAIFTFTVGSIFRWQGSVTVPSGGCCSGLARFYSPSTIPTSASPGTYNLEVLISYKGEDIDNQTYTYGQGAFAFTVR